MFVVGIDGFANGLAPSIGAKGADVFVLGEGNGLHEGLHHVGDGACKPRLYFAANNGGDKAGKSGAEIACGEVVAGEEVGQVFAERDSGLGLGFFLGVVEAEVGVARDARRAAAAAIGERE